MFLSKSQQILKKFRQGVFYEEIYKEFEITEKTLISILQRNIKGNYNYRKVLSSHEAQKQFIRHLNSRWNPLKPEPFETIPPYLPTDKDGKKPRKLNKDDLIT